MSKNKSVVNAPPTTRTSIASKLATMASAGRSEEISADNDGVSMSQLVTELTKQRASIKEDISALIQESLVPLQTSVNALTETLASFQSRLCATESLASDNFSALSAAEKTIQTLKEQNVTLMDRVDDLENRSRRANLRILNVPENSEKGQSTVTFVSEMLVEVMGQEVFEKPPELERAHRSLGPKPQEGRPPRPLVICFHKFQEKEKALRWARQNEAKYKGSTLRIYPDISADLARKRAAFKNVKQLLYQKNVRFQLLHPARLRVRHEDETFLFHTPEEAQQFYDQRIATHE